MLIIAVYHDIWYTIKETGVGQWLPVSYTARMKHPIHKRYFFSANEQRLFECLQQILANSPNQDAHLLAKVRWEDIIGADMGAQWKRYRGYLKSRHIDFVILDTKTNIPSCLIELNDSTHRNPSVMERDNRLQEFCDNTDTPLLFLRTQGYYDPEDIKEKINECIISTFNSQEQHDVFNLQEDADIEHVNEEKERYFATIDEEELLPPKKIEKIQEKYTTPHTPTEPKEKGGKSWIVWVAALLIILAPIWIF